MELIKYNCEFYESFSPQRGELRKLWNDTETDWKDYLKENDLQVLKISDALGINLKEISITYSIIDLQRIYNELYKIN
jgi:hypothetical protein